nr:deoxyribose-phosphate aldolase [uncultured Bacillus sp.]
MTINRMIDHTNLKPDTSKDSIMQLLNEAKEFHFASVCVNPAWVELAANELKGTDVKVCTVIGFPLGANTMDTKVFETKDAIEKGTQEVDMVINISRLKDGDYPYVKSDIIGVVEAAKGKALVKVIIETCLLTNEEKEVACRLALEAGADYVKTSTGFSTGGATVKDVALMSQIVGQAMGVKASGGLRTKQDAEAMIEAGATRLGTSSGIAIMKEW